MAVSQHKMTAPAPALCVFQSVTDQQTANILFSRLLEEETVTTRLRGNQGELLKRYHPHTLNAIVINTVAHLNMNIGATIDLDIKYTTRAKYNVRRQWWANGCVSTLVVGRY